MVDEVDFASIIAIAMSAINDNLQNIMPVVPPVVSGIESDYDLRNYYGFVINLTNLDPKNPKISHILTHDDTSGTWKQAEIPDDHDHTMVMTNFINTIHNKSVVPVVPVVPVVHDDDPEMVAVAIVAANEL